MGDGLEQEIDYGGVSERGCVWVDGEVSSSGDDGWMAG